MHKGPILLESRQMTIQTFVGPSKRLYLSLTADRFRLIALCLCGGFIGPEVFNGLTGFTYQSTTYHCLIRGKP